MSLGLNLGYEWVKLGKVACDHADSKVHKQVDGLKVTEKQLQVMSDMTNKLSHAKQKDKKIDFSRDETMRKYAYFVHLRNENILGGKIHNLPVQEGDLEKTLTKIIGEMLKEGIPENEIKLENIMERFKCDDNIRFDVLDEGTIDVVIQGVDAEVNMLKADLSKHFMGISSTLEERQNVLKAVNDGRKEDSEMKRSFIGKMGKV